MIKIYGIKNCNNVKKALNFFQNKEFIFIDFKKTPPSNEDLARWLKQIPIQKLINTKGLTYKKLKLKDQALSPQELQDYLLKEPLLIKRPVIEIDGAIIVGYNQEQLQEQLKA